MEKCKCCGSSKTDEVDRDGKKIGQGKKIRSPSRFFKCRDCGNTTHFKFRHKLISGSGNRGLPVTQRGTRLVVNAA